MYIDTESKRLELRRAVAESDLSLQAVMAIVEILDSIEFPTPEQEAYVKDVEAQISAALEMLRNEIGMPWNLVNRKRINELAAALAELLPDWSVNDAFLAGTYLAASARSQIRSEAETEGHPIVTEAEVSQNMAAIAASANQDLGRRNAELEQQVAMADDIARMASNVLIGLVQPNEVVKAALEYKNRRGL